MLPQLTPDRCPVVSVPPPARYRALSGVPRLVSWSSSQAKGSKGFTEAQKSGLRYEAKVQDYLIEKLGPSYLPAPYLHFVDDNGYRTLVPDGLFLTYNGRVVIFEIKSQHMSEAWYQLRKLYEPVVKQLDFVKQTSCIEVVKSFDPAMPFPEDVRLCPDLESALASPLELFKVLKWRP